MFNTKIGDNNLTVTIEETVRKNLIKSGVNPMEIHKLIVNFAGTLLATKKDEDFYITNEETGASLVLSMKWTAEKEVAVNVMQAENIADDRDKRVDLKPRPEETSAN